MLGSDSRDMSNTIHSDLILVLTRYIQRSSVIIEESLFLSKCPRPPLVNTNTNRGGLHKPLRLDVNPFI